MIPEDVNGRTKLKVVYVVLEAQYQSALTAAVRNINATREKVRTSLSASTQSVKSITRSYRSKAEHVAL